MGNPQITKLAIALKYRAGLDSQPKVVASGKGLIAEHIEKVARDAQIPIHEDGPLAGLLSKVELGQAIPPELYQLVAEVLVLVLKMDQRAKMESQASAHPLQKFKAKAV